MFPVNTLDTKIQITQWFKSETQLCFVRSGAESWEKEIEQDIKETPTLKNQTWEQARHTICPELGPVIKCVGSTVERPMPHMSTLRATNTTALCERVTAHWHMGQKTHTRRARGKEKSYKKRETEEVSEGEIRKKGKDPLSKSRGVGEMTACPGCRADMTLKMIKYAGIMSRIHSGDCTQTLTVMQDRKILHKPDYLKQKKNTKPGFTLSWCTWPTWEPC